jgi:hypothetical protein
MRPTRFLLALIATLAPALGHAGGFADIEVYDRTAGRTLPIHEYEGRLYVAGEPRHQYELRIRNSSSHRVLAVTSVDGVNVISGQTAAQQQSGYVLDAWDSVQIEGWRKNMDEVATFYFTRLADSYAARTGRPHDVGVIGVALFREYREHRPVAAACDATSNPRLQPRRAPMRPSGRAAATPPVRVAANRSWARATDTASHRPRTTSISAAHRRRPMRRSSSVTIRARTWWRRACCPGRIVHGSPTAGRIRFRMGSCRTLEGVRPSSRVETRPTQERPSCVGRNSLRLVTLPPVRRPSSPGPADSLSRR